MHHASALRRSPRALAACFVLACAGGTLAKADAPTLSKHAPVPVGIGNDSCATPDFISGNGIFAFNNHAATTGHEGQQFRQCDFGDGRPGIENDEWFCWTANCTGVVEITTCGLTQVDTKIALYRECACPTDDRPPICCADDECGRQTSLRCDVQCGERYMIQIGNKPGTAPGVGSFSITCHGEECGHCPPPECCGAKPTYHDSDYATFTGQVMVMTAEVQWPINLSDFAVTVFDIKDHGTAPLNVHWNPPNFRYNDPRWTKGNLGSLFGVTLDDQGNIYAGHTTIYNSGDLVGAIAGSTAGTIYQLATMTGDPTVFVNLPNNGPGLGNLSWDCEHDQIFASNMEDGRVYRVRSDGTFLSAFDHATGVVTPAILGVIANEPGEPNGQFAALGERVWAVKKAGDRLYYSVWSRDSRNMNNGSSPLPPNQIWSIQLDGSGDFIAGTVTLELTMPAYPGNLFSEPVSDISFSPESPALMLCAERNMTSDTNSYAHDARLLEFECTSGSWSLTANNTNINGPTFGFPIGQLFSDTNCSGGCDYDTEPNGRIWCSGDALHYLPGDYIYGGAAMLRTGATSPTDILFDYNSDVTGVDKSQLGDVVIPCQPAAPCMIVTHAEARCEGTFYSATFTITNTSGMAVSYILLPNAQVSPNVIPLSPPLANGASTTVTVTLSGVTPNTTFCFDIILADADVHACCSGRVCVDIPRCDCVEFVRTDVTCDPITGLPTVTLTFVNLRPEVLEHAFFIPLAPHAGADITPDYLPLPSVPPGGTVTLPAISIAGVPAGDTVCIRMSVHDGHLMECCSVVICFVVPPPCSGEACPPDFNDDGVLNSADFFGFVSAFFSSDSSADYDRNGTVDTEDFFTFLTDYFATCD